VDLDVTALCCRKGYVGCSCLRDECCGEGDPSRSLIDGEEYYTYAIAKWADDYMGP
jgi:hypothetical protein